MKYEWNRMDVDSQYVGPQFNNYYTSDDIANISNISDYILVTSPQISGPQVVSNTDYIISPFLSVNDKWDGKHWIIQYTLFNLLIKFRDPRVHCDNSNTDCSPIPYLNSPTNVTQNIWLNIAI